jgi:hypothetical protein
MTVKRMPPTISPREALDRMKDLPLDGRLELDGFVYTLDAPAMCNDRSYFYPVVSIGDDEEATYWPSGDVGDPITDETTWIDLDNDLGDWHGRNE